METVVLTRQHIAKIVNEKGFDDFMDRMIARLGEVFREGGHGGITPARDGFVRGPGDTAILEWMPHHRPGESITIKTVGYTPSNPAEFRLPTIIGTMTRYDDVTGRLLAVCDGILPTAIRTGAASAIASRLLARPDSRVLGLVGAGAQAVTQAHALSRVFPLERIVVHDIDPEHARSFAERVEFLGLDVKVATVAEIEAEADIICTVTSVAVGDGPVLLGENLRPHVHINAIGADLIGKFEVPRHVLKSAFVTADHRDQSLREGRASSWPTPTWGRTSWSCARSPPSRRTTGTGSPSSTPPASRWRTTWPSTSCSNSPRRRVWGTTSRSSSCRRTRSTRTPSRRRAAGRPRRRDRRGRPVRPAPRSRAVSSGSRPAASSRARPARSGKDP